MAANLPEFKFVMRVNNQISLSLQRLSKKREPFFYAPENDSHFHSTNRLLRYHLRCGRDSYYDSVSRTVRFIEKPSPSGFSKNSTAYLDLISGFQDNLSCGSSLENQAKRGWGTAPPSPENQAKRGWGAAPRVKSFSAKSGQKVREAGAAIDILCDGDPSFCRVVTLTLPASGQEAYSALSNYSGFATNRLLQVLRDGTSKNERLYYFYCWEHQKRGALHLHLCLCTEDRGKSEKLGEALVSKWENILHDISRKSGVALLFSRGFGRQVTSGEIQSLNQQMFFGCGAYFSKYASKTSYQNRGGEGESIDSRNARLYPPSTFWGSSRDLKAVIREHSFSWKFEGMECSEAEEEFSRALELLNNREIVRADSFSFKKEVRTEDGGFLTVAEGITFSFYVSQKDYVDMLNEVKVIYDSRPTSLIPERAKKGGYCFTPVGGSSSLEGIPF